ncbi:MULTISPECIES: hypothetical protein [unclassified Microcoleus]
MSHKLRLPIDRQTDRTRVQACLNCVSIGWIWLNAGLPKNVVLALNAE